MGESKGVLSAIE